VDEGAGSISVHYHGSRTGKVPFNIQAGGFIVFYRSCTLE
jgi:hypothetical protein